MTTKLDDLLNETKSRGGRPCLLRSFLNELPPDERDSVQRAIFNEDISARHIWQVLREHRGATFSHSVIHHHRRGMCASCLTNS